MKAYLTRRYMFSASHRLNNDMLSPEENQRLYGKCNNPYGHGHNYMLEVTVGGVVDQRTGMVCDLVALDQVVKREVLDALDHRFLNKEVPEFAAKNPTTENIAISIWQRVAPSFATAQLHRVRVHETPDLFVDYYGEE